MQVNAVDDQSSTDHQNHPSNADNQASGEHPESHKTTQHSPSPEEDRQTQETPIEDKKSGVDSVAQHSPPVTSDGIKLASEDRLRLTVEDQSTKPTFDSYDGILRDPQSNNGDCDEHAEWTR